MQIVDYDFDPRDPSYPRFQIYADAPFTRPFDTIDHLVSIVCSIGLNYSVEYVVWNEKICFHKEEHRTMFLLKYKPVDFS